MTKLKHVIDRDSFHGISPKSLKNDEHRKNFENLIYQHCFNKTVIDLGTGSGILAYMAYKAGAKKIYAVENNTILCQRLKSIFKSLKMDDKIVVLNVDFVHDDISEIYNVCDVVVAEVFSKSLISNFGPRFLRDLKNNYKHLTIIPDYFKFQLSICESENLNEEINFNYEDIELNNFLNLTGKFFLPNVTLIPSKKIVDINYSNKKIVLTYDFITNDIIKNFIEIPENRKNKWLEISSSYVDTFYAYEYIPLDLEYFKNVKTIGIAPDNNLCHKVVKEHG